MVRPNVTDTWTEKRTNGTPTPRFSFFFPLPSFLPSKALSFSTLIGLFCSLSFVLLFAVFLFCADADSSAASVLGPWQQVFDQASAPS